MGKHVRLLAVLIAFPALAMAQTSRPIPEQGPMFEVLRGGRWVRGAGTAYARREARVLDHGATEIVLHLERPLRIPVTSVDTLWNRRTASKTGALVGGLLGASIGVLVATQAVEK